MGAANRVDLSERLRRVLLRPVRLVPLAFLAVIGVGTLLLMLPAAHASSPPDLMVASFTAVSAVCVTGLATVDTATYWTPFGQGVILGLVQVGGFGIMSLATLLGLLIRGRLGMRNQLQARAETRAFDGGGDVRVVLRRIALSVLSIEAVIALVLTIRFRSTYDSDLGTALWHGVFHAVSAFNNAGFALYSKNLVGFATDAWIVWPICAAIIVGGLGFPVLFELTRRWRRPAEWTTHTRITVTGTIGLLVAGTLLFALFEWANPATIGGMTPWERLVTSTTAAVVPRTAGFNSIDYGQITPATLVITLVLMFIGGGSAGTAGGVKVTTFFLLGFIILAEARGDDDVIVGRRAIARSTQRQALSIALLGVGAVTLGTVLLVVLTGLPLDAVAFEAVSAFATVGLSTGITPTLPPAAQIVLMVLMFVGRVGTVTVASALALRRRNRRYHYPEERPIVG